MLIKGFIWLPNIVDKLDWKHNVSEAEVEDVFQRKPLFRKVEKGHIPGENLYLAMGTTSAGRYLTVFFIYKLSNEALIISARNMEKNEKNIYKKH